MTCSAEFPCYPDFRVAYDGHSLKWAPATVSATPLPDTFQTIPAPPPEDDGGTLHTMTLTDAQQTIAVLKEREAEHLHTIMALEQRVANLETELYSRGSERR